MTTSHWQRPQNIRTPDIITDVVIVGGGFVGLSTAFWITEMRPDLKITVLERAFCGSGASGRNAGFLTMGSASFYKGLTLKWSEKKAKEIFSFAEESLELVHEKILKVSPEISFEKSSSMTLFRTQEQLSEWTHQSFEPARFNFQWKNSSELPEHLKEKFAGAYEASPEYKVNPVQLLGSMRKILEQRNVQIVESLSAFELTPEGVSTEINEIKARQVVLALNGYFPQFHQAFKNVIVPRRAQMLAVELEEDFNCPSLYYDPPERVYWRKTAEKVLVVGGKRLLDEEGETGDFEKITAVIQRGLEAYLNDQLGLRYKVINRWSGTMGFTDHELPIMERIQAPVDCFIVGGFSGHGMGLGFRSGLEMALLVTGVKNESFFSGYVKSNLSI
jgi:gamma-glutamylputrescine oxidase